MDEVEIDGGLPEEMARAQRLTCGAMAGQADAHCLKTELLGLGEQLKALVDTYEERPSAIDRGTLSTSGNIPEVEAMITKVYQIMKRWVFAYESPLGVETDLWEAFKEQEDEFVEFYKSAINAIEVHKEVLRHYKLAENEARLRPRHGDLEGIRQDNRAYVTERDQCITAVGNFSAKFLAMLIVLCS